MNIEELAEELIAVRAQIDQSERNKQVDQFVRGEMQVLKVLCNKKTPTHPNTLSDEISVSTARVARTLNQLEKKNWVIRRPDPDDSRKTVVIPTEEGQKAYKEQHDKFLKLTIDLVEKMGEDDAKELLRLHKKLLKYGK